jgi:hypothetical protein
MAGTRNGHNGYYMHAGTATGNSNTGTVHIIELSRRLPSGESRAEGITGLMSHTLLDGGAALAARGR